MTSLRLRTLCSLTLALSILPGCPSTPAPSGGDSGVDAASVSDAAVDTDAGMTADAAVPLDVGLDTGGDSGPTADAGLEFAGAYVRPSCGPADGPAFQLDLFQGSVGPCEVDPTLRSLGFYVHDLSGATLPPTAGTVIRSTPALPSGTANRCPGGTPPCQSTETWTLTFASYVTGTGAMGTYSVTWEDGSTSTGQFDAGWCGDMPLCG